MTALQAPGVIHQAIVAACAGRGVAHLTLPQDVIAAKAEGELLHERQPLHRWSACPRGARADAGPLVHCRREPSRISTTPPRNPYAICSTIWGAKGSAWSSHVSVRTCDPTWTGTASRQRSGKRRFSRRFTKLSLRCALALLAPAQMGLIQKSSLAVSGLKERL